MEFGKVVRELGPLVGGQRPLEVLLLVHLRLQHPRAEAGLREVEFSGDLWDALAGGADGAHRLGLELRRELAPLAASALDGLGGLMDTSFIMTDSQG